MSLAKHGSLVLRTSLACAATYFALQWLTSDTQPSLKLLGVYLVSGIIGGVLSIGIFRLCNRTVVRFPNISGLSISLLLMIGTITSGLEAQNLLSAILLGIAFYICLLMLCGKLDTPTSTSPSAN